MTGGDQPRLPNTSSLVIPGVDGEILLMNLDIKGFSVSTGAYTGRTPRDKYIVEEPGTKETVWWGQINQPVAPERFDSLHQRMLAYFQRRELFVQDLYAGADPDYRLPWGGRA